MGIRIDRITLREIRMPLVHFFETSFGRTTERRIVLVEVSSDGLSGWGEVTCGENPFYNEEWTESAWLILRNYVAPRVVHHDFEHAADVGTRSAHIRGHLMAQGGLEVAIWDLEARMLGEPLYRRIGGGARREIPCGVSIGIQDTVPQLLQKIETELAAGYQRIKMKIKPGWDVDVVRQVRKRFPDILLMADANSAYTLADAPLLKALDDFNLMMIEQPLAHDEIIDHAKLQAQLKTPICLDECIRSAHQAQQAIAMDAGAHHQHQAGARRRIRRSQARARCRARRGHPCLVRRHAGSRHRPGAQHRARHTSEFHAAGRRLGQQALLGARYHPTARGSDAARNNSDP